MLVTPPAAAAAAPLSIRSLCSAPGSPSWTRMSTRPGARHSPLASITSAPPGASAAVTAGPSSAIRAAHDQHPAARIEPGRRVEQPGIDDEDRPAHWAVLAQVPGQRVEHRHAHRHAHLDLIEDGAAVDVVGHHAVDLDAAVHRPRMHDQRVRLGRPQLVVGRARRNGSTRATEGTKLPCIRSVCSRSIITMSTSSSPRCMSVNTSTPKPSIPAGSRVVGRHHPHPGAHRQQQQDVRARHPAVQDVAADRHRQALDPALAAADGQRVEQGLGRVLVRPVAGVDDGAVDVPRQQGHGPAVLMAHHQHVRVHGVQRHRRVDQRLALLHGRARHRHVDHVGPQPLAGQLEAGLGTGAALEEQVDLGQTPEQLQLLVGLPVQRDEAVGTLQQILDLVRLQALDPEEVLVLETEVGGGGGHRARTMPSSRPRGKGATDEPALGCTTALAISRYHESLIRPTLILRPSYQTE